MENTSVRGDRALGPDDVDKLGFREVAARIATPLVDRAASEDGLVVGVEGTWGSGKSSLLFLIGDELSKLNADRKPTIISFRPWLISNRDALIGSLLGELSRELDQVALSIGDATPISVAKAKKAGEALRSFMTGLSKAGAAIEVAGDASGVGWLKWSGKGISAVGNITQKKSATPQLSQLKDKLASSLRELNHRFIITIDDVDRLEPSEVIEVLRLVRSVADLPNVVYLLCYDSEILAHSIEEAAKVKSGQSYLEKIVQLTVMVPKPEPFQLRHWFTEELHLISSAKNEDERSRLQQVVDYEGGRQLRTPRSVVRALDAIRFYWPPIRDAEGDLSDLVWLQLIKDGNPALYRWIESYCGLAAAISLGTARIEQSEMAKELAAFLSTVDDDHFDEEMYRHYFSAQLPGVEADLSENGAKFKIFERVDEQERDEAIQKKRLSSPDHYRLYFALSGPSHALTQDDFDSAWSATAAGAEESGIKLLQFYDEVAAQSLTKVDILLERLKGGGYQTLSPEQSENLLISFSQVLDDAYRRQKFDLFWISSVWNRAERLIPSLLSRLDEKGRNSVVNSMFCDGAAIGWLTSLLRRETFAHGRYGDQKRASDEWLFTEAELDRIIEIMVGRYRDMSTAELLGSPSPLSILFAWRQTGDEDGPRKLVGSSIETDEGFVQTLEQLLSVRHSSHRGEYATLTEENLAPFMDYDAATRRAEALKANTDLGARAKRLVQAFIDAAD